MLDLEEFKWRFSYADLDGLASQLEVTDEFWEAIMQDISNEEDGKISYDQFK